MKYNFLNISIFILLFLSNTKVFSIYLDSEDESIPAFKFLKRNKDQDKYPQEDYKNQKTIKNELADLVIGEDDLNPILADSSILGKKYIYLETLEVKRKLIVRGEKDFFAVVSDIPGKQMHVFSHIYTESCNLAQLIPAFFREKIDADKVFIIKDLTCRPDNINSKKHYEKLESILIERRLNSNCHKIMFKYKNSSECSTCFWDESTQVLSPIQNISCSVKDYEQKKLVREFWKTKNLNPSDK